MSGKNKSKLLRDKEIQECNTCRRWWYSWKAAPFQCPTCSSPGQ